MTTPTHCARPGCGKPLPARRPRFCSDYCCNRVSKYNHFLRSRANGTRCTCGNAKQVTAAMCPTCEVKPPKPAPVPAPVPVKAEPKRRTGTIANIKPRACKADANGHGCQCQICTDRRVDEIVKRDLERRKK